MGITYRQPTSQTTSTMLRIFYIAATFCLLLNQVSALTCCEGLDDSCSTTCTTSAKCVTTQMTFDSTTIVMRACEDKLTGSSEACKGLESASKNGCLDVKIDNPQGAGKIDTKVCCCDGHKCNGGNGGTNGGSGYNAGNGGSTSDSKNNGSNYQYGSVFLTLTMAVLSRFI